MLKEKKDAYGRKAQKVRAEIVDAEIRRGDDPMVRTSGHYYPLGKYSRAEEEMLLASRHHPPLKTVSEMDDAISPEEAKFASDEYDFQCSMGHENPLVDNICSADVRIEQRLGVTADIRSFFTRICCPRAKRYKPGDIAPWPISVVGLRYLIAADNRIPILEKLDAFSAVVCELTTRRATQLRGDVTYAAICQLIDASRDVASVLNCAVVLLSTLLDPRRDAKLAIDWGTPPTAERDETLYAYLSTTLSYFWTLQEQEHDFSYSLTRALSSSDGATKPKFVDTDSTRKLKKQISRLVRTNQELARTNQELARTNQEKDKTIANLAASLANVTDDNKQHREQQNAAKAAADKQRTLKANLARSPEKKRSLLILALCLIYDLDEKQCNFKDYGPGSTYDVVSFLKGISKCKTLTKIFDPVLKGPDAEKVMCIIAEYRRCNYYPNKEELSADPNKKANIENFKKGTYRALTKENQPPPPLQKLINEKLPPVSKKRRRKSQS